MASGPDFLHHWEEVSVEMCLDWDVTSARGFSRDYGPEATV